MAGRPKSLDDTKIFDVSRPGRTRPMGTSRPVISSPHQSVRDQTIIERRGNEATPLLPPSASKRMIMPANSAEEVEQEPKVETTNEPMIEEALPESTDHLNVLVHEPEDISPLHAPGAVVAPEATPEIEESSKPDNAAAPVTNQTNMVDQEQEKPAPADAAGPEALLNKEQSGTPELNPSTPQAETVDVNKQNVKEKEAADKRDQELQQLIDSKKYAIPISHETASGRSKWLWVTALLLVVGGAAYIIMSY